MKPDIHPTYYPKARVKCACGNVFTVGATKESIEVEICSQCHPFYTGQEKLVDTLGRVEKFKEKLEKAKQLKAEKKTSSEKQAKKTVKKKRQGKKILKGAM